MSETTEAILRLLLKDTGMSSPEIAELTGSTAGYVRKVASENGISLRKPSEVNPKRIYYGSVPKGKEEAFAGMVADIMRAKGLRSQSAAWVYAVEFTHKALSDA